MSALPNDKNHVAMIDEILRVNHAGEYGAQQIYKGQLAILSRDECAPILQKMAAQEAEHLRQFEALMIAREARPTALLPFWHVAGYALGAATALMGKDAAMACTVAVESVISEHYADQEALLAEKEPALHSTIATFRSEEEAHHAIGLEQGAENAVAYPLLSAMIKAGCRAAIAVAKKV